MKAKELLQSYADGLRNFSEAELASLSLVGAKLSHVNLESATLADTNLSKADLFNAKLCKVRFARANLSEADLGEADLREANLREANLAGANLTGATLMNANLSGSNLSGACLSGAKLLGANLTEVNLTDANLKSASLAKAQLIRTDLTNADFTRANFYQAVISLVKLRNTILHDAVMPNGKYFAHPNLYILDNINNPSDTNSVKLNTSELIQLEAYIQDAVAILYWNIPRNDSTTPEAIKSMIIKQINKYIRLKVALFSSLEQLPATGE
ncbi:MAG: pentapeptide repeat-containing protein [Rivularia sp. (in: Bacteria)]|nr:pentapeptide repeat-containing protein [Rivularia sp. MS3]